MNSGMISGFARHCPLCSMMSNIQLAKKHVNGEYKHDKYSLCHGTSRPSDDLLCYVTPVINT